jgi:hypothetical protein
VGLLERIGGRAEKRSSIDQWITDYLIPSQFTFNGSSYPLGLNQTLPAQRIQQVARRCPGTRPRCGRARRRSPRRWSGRWCCRRPGSRGGTCRGRRHRAGTFGTAELGLLERPVAERHHRGPAVDDGVARRADRQRVRGPAADRLRVLRPDWCGLVFGVEQEPERRGDRAGR